MAEHTRNSASGARLAADCKLTQLSHPLQCALLPDPDVTDDQDAEEDEHLEQSEQAKCLELHGPGKEENRLHIEDHKQDGNNIVANGVAASRAVDRINAAFVGQELFAMRIAGPNQLG